MTYTLMHKDILVADLKIVSDVATVDEILEIHNANHIPIGLYDKDKIDLRKLNKWWKGRSIPASRLGLSDAIDILNISIPEELILKCYGLSLSDQYWVKPENSNLTWEKINFFDNDFSDDVGNALFGNEKNIDEISLISPDNTSDGFLKKKWSIVGGQRYLMKSGSRPFFQEPLNELLASKVQGLLNYMPYVDYTVLWDKDIPYSVCKNFVTQETELVNAININETITRNNNESPYSHFLNCCENFGIKNAKEQIDYMLIVDYIIANSDRHFRNFGALRNANTLEWISMAPVFDCGTSMWHNQITKNIKPIKYDESKPFKNTHHEQIKLVDDFDWIDFSILREISDICNDVYKGSLYIDDDRRSSLCYAINHRVDMLEKIALDKVQSQGIGMKI